MEPLWSPVVATGGNRSQITSTRKRLKQAKTVAAGCGRLPQAAHGKEGVDGSSPSEGLQKNPANEHVSRPRDARRGAGPVLVGSSGAAVELVGTRPFAQIHEARPQKVL